MSKELREKIEFAKKEIAGLAAILVREIQDMGQGTVAQQKLGNILEVIDQTESLIRTENETYLGEFIAWLSSVGGGDDRNQKEYFSHLSSAVEGFKQSQREVEE